MVFNDKNKDKKVEEDVEAEFIPALSKKQKKKMRLAELNKEHDHQVANIANSASKIVATKTNSFGGFAAYVGVHAIDFLLGSDSAGSKKKNKKKKNKNKQEKRK